MSLIDTYSEFQQLSSSDKIGLVIIEASKRLMGWELHSGSIYKLENFDFQKIVLLEDSGVDYTEATSIAGVTASKYYNDRVNKTIYLRTSDSVNPNSKFIVMTFQMYFSNVSFRGPHDLDEGFEVEWLPILRNTSSFGVELDNQNLLGFAIEGSGSITFFNDRSFWDSKFDKFYFENQLVRIYSYNRILPIQEAKLIYRGRIQTKTYSTETVSFGLKDIINQLRAQISIPLLSNISGARIPSSLTFAKQRLIYGYVYGFRPTNIDQVLNGYPITGTVSVSSGSATLTGSGTQFLAQLSPDDQILIGDDTQAYSIKTITSNTVAELTENYEGASQSGEDAVIQPSHPKRWQNRLFKLSSHKLREPITEIEATSSSLNDIQVVDPSDIRPDEEIIIGTEVHNVRSVSGNIIRLKTTLSNFPGVGTTVLRPTVQNVYINKRKLTFDRDYMYDAVTGEFTLDTLAEFNVAPIRFLQGSATITSGSRVVSGTGTAFKKEVSLGDWIAGNGQDTYFEVISIDTDTQLTLRTTATYTQTSALLQKKPEVYNEGSTILSCDIIGATENGETDGILIYRAGQIVKDLLIRAGLQDSINEDSFTSAKDLYSHRLGLAIPDKFTDTAAPKVRDTINRINQSVFGSLFQNRDFEFEYSVLRPKKPTSSIKLFEADILNLSIESDSSRIVKTVNVNYHYKEYDPLSATNINSSQTFSSNNSIYLARSDKTFDVNTLLVDEYAAYIYSARWAFILETASSKIKIQTKMQLARAQIQDSVYLETSKIYERVGSSTKSKVAGVETASRSFLDSQVELEDLANAFSRCAIITDSNQNNYANSSDRERSFNGYITDEFGMQDNDPETFGINLIW